MILKPHSLKFIKIIVIEAFFWALMGSLLCYWMHWSPLPYLAVVGIALVGLLLLMKIVQIMTNSQLPVAMKVSQFLFFSFFKLVCLVFLAITLKRFQELSPIPVLIGASFYWVAPLIAGVICSKD